LPKEGVPPGFEGGRVVLGLVTHRMFTNLKSFDHRAQYRTSVRRLI